MNKKLLKKQSWLEHRLRELGGVWAAYSGGVDSTYRAWSARQVLGGEMLAAIADSPSLARSHLADALRFASQHRIPLQVLPTSEINNPDYAKNDAFWKPLCWPIAKDQHESRRFTQTAWRDPGGHITPEEGMDCPIPIYL